MLEAFENYVKNGKVKKKTPDPEEGQALLQQAKDRLWYVSFKEITERAAKFVFEDAYEAAREAAQSLMSKRGYKPYSHEATISFIQEFYNSNFRPEEIARLEHFRQLRHDSVYRAVPIFPEDAKSCFLFAKMFVKKVELLDLSPKKSLKEV